MIPGIDVSHHQGAIDWPAVASSGVRFAFVRTGDGITTRDRAFERNWRDCKRAGLIRGPYHFLRASVSPVLQADALIDAVYASDVYATDDLPPGCDLEELSLGAGVTPSRAVDCALAFAASLEARLGRAPVLYTSPNTMATLGRDAERLSGRYPTLWIAHYGVDAPRVPAPYRAWAFWQHTGSGQCAGVSGQCDLDWYRGDESGLRDLIAMSEVMAS